MAVRFVVAQNADSNATFGRSTRRIKPFSIAIGLEILKSPHQTYPFVAAKRGWTVVSVSDKRMQGDGLLGDDSEPDVLLPQPSHAETDLRERCVPIRW